ncbi:Pseudoazurin precursor [Marinomonas aquimarina]|uniref:Pseudoazurin n=1 Tax=Marinomonas aquimarina TaxID=295068 RepID=A0A1A8T440_9GAMM|nr:plastocyanin/azurin family copper-binding protein [Marinomonas aquimarina]SBS26961.1 Pseudoazurin precursor [Marinomonas aquimarina]
MYHKVVMAWLALTTVTSLSAKDWQVQMLSFGDKGPMVFEPDFIQAQVGDTVTFVPTQPGHYVQSYVTAEGQDAWTSTFNETYQITLNNEGVNLYYCPPHLMMGMVGMIQVGEAINSEVIETRYPELRDKITLNPERVDLILDNLK